MSGSANDVFALLRIAATDDLDQVTEAARRRGYNAKLAVRAAREALSYNTDAAHANAGALLRADADQRAARTERPTPLREIPRELYRDVLRGLIQARTLEYSAISDSRYVDIETPYGRQRIFLRDVEYLLPVGADPFSDAPLDDYPIYAPQWMTKNFGRQLARDWAAAHGQVPDRDTRIELGLEAHDIAVATAWATSRLLAGDPELLVAFGGLRKHLARKRTRAHDLGVAPRPTPKLTKSADQTHEYHPL